MEAKYMRLANRLKEQINQNKGSRSFKLPTEKELGELYGVSRQTVRAALHVLSEEGYLRKQQGSGSYALPPASRNRDQEYAILLPSDSEYLYPSILRSLQSVIRQSGNYSSLYLTNSDLAKERHILESLLHSSIRGILVKGIQTNIPNPNIDLYEQLIAKDVLVIFLEEPYRNLSHVSSIRMDNFYGGYLAGKHALGKQHRNFAGIFQIDSLSGVERYSGLMSALKDMSCPIPSTQICWYTISQYEQLQKEQDTCFLKDFIKKQVISCSCVVCQNDEIAYWLIRELQNASCHVPVDVSVISFGNSYLSELSPVPITSLAPKSADFSVLLQSALLNRQQIDHVFSWKLVERGSVSQWQTD